MKGDAMILKPTNSRFKRLIAEFGNQWTVINGPVWMHCFGSMGVTCSPVSNPQKFSNFRAEEIAP